MNIIPSSVLVLALGAAGIGESSPIPLPWASTISPRQCLDRIEIAPGYYYADGPIHFAPVVSDGKYYFTSDDGHLYCVEGKSGKLLWKVLGGPNDMKMVDADAGRMISAWPARGGAVVHEGRVYFGAGLFAVQGVFLCCVDAQSGQLIWRRDLSPAGEVGPIPLGPLSVVEIVTRRGDKQWVLKVPQGEGAQGFIDFTLDGKFCQHEQLDLNGRRGNWKGVANIIWHGADSGLRVGVDPWYWSGRHRNPDAPPPAIARPEPKKRAVKVDPNPEVILLPTAFDANRQRLTARLDASTKESGAAAELAEAILTDATARQGYALVLGLGDGRLAEQLALRSDLHVIAVDRDEKLVTALRRRWTDLGIYSTRITACVADPMKYRAAKWCADIVVVDTQPLARVKAAAELPSSVLETLHPYRGSAYFLDSRFEVKQPRAKGYELRKADRFTIVRRRGGVEGGADFGHTTGTAGGTNASADIAVKAPLSALWFGARPAIARLFGGGAPPVLIAEGRAFAQGGFGIREARQEPLWMLKDDHAAAFDVYTGRQLWERHATNGALAAVGDVLYHGSGNDCEVLDAASGKRLFTFQGFGNQPQVSGRFLVITAENSDMVTCLDRLTRTVLWRLKRPEIPKIGQSLVVGGGKLMVLTLEEAEKPRVRVIDLASGKTQTEIDLARDLEVSTDKGPRIGKHTRSPYDLHYQEDVDVLVARCYKPLDKPGSAGKAGPATYQVAGYGTRDGKLLWSWSNLDFSLHVTHAAIIGRGFGKHGHVGYVFDLHTGKQTATWEGYRGCGLQMTVNEWLALSRSEIASYYDLERLSGYHPLGPFRLSCGSRSAIGNGVLFKPDEHWGCACMTVLHMAVGYIHNPEIGPVTHVPSIGMEQVRKQGFAVGETTSWAGSRYVRGK